MAEGSPFRVEIRVEPEETPVSPVLRVGTLADRKARYTVDLVPGGQLDRIDVRVDSSRWKLTVPADATAQLSFRRRRETPIVRLRAEMALEVAVRAPARRGRDDIYAGRLAAGGEAELTLDLPAEDSWTLARAAREIARWIDPRSWARARRPPPGSVWRLTEEVPVELSGSARVRRLLTGSSRGASALAPLAVAPELEARLARLERVRAELRVFDDRQLRARLYSLSRRQHGVAASLDLGWSLRRPEALVEALLAALGPDLSEVIRQMRAALEQVREVQQRIEQIPEEIRRLGGRAVGPGSRLERLELRLAEIEALMDALLEDDPRREHLEPVRELRQRVAALRARAREWIDRVAALAERLDPEQRLPRFAAELTRVVRDLARLEERLVEAAGSVLAEGLSVELAAHHRRTRERQRLAEVWLAAGRSKAAPAAVLATITGRLPDLIDLEGAPGVERVAGRIVTAAKRRRTRALRLRIGDLGLDQRSVWTGELRVTRSLDGAIEVRARERLERRRRRMASGDVAALLVDLVLAGQLGQLDPSLTLRWSQSWRGRRTRTRAEEMLARTIAALDLPLEPEALPEAPGELVVRSRLDPAAIVATLRADWPAATFAEQAFWPAWASAIESGYRLVPPPALRAGRHPLRRRRLRRALRRAPFARTVAELQPGLGRLEQESIAADWRVGRALLDALQTARRVSQASGQPGPEALSRLGQRVVRVMRHVGAIDLVPLIAITALVPPAQRNIDVHIELDTEQP